MSDLAAYEEFLENRPSTDVHVALLKHLESREWGEILACCNVLERRVDTKIELGQLHSESNSLLGVEYFSKYLQMHMGLLLYFDKLCEAKFLWKRWLSLLSKFENQEFESCWALGRALWKRDYENFYNEIDQKDWTEGMAPLIQALRAKVAEDQLELCARAYKVVPLDTVAKRTGMLPEEASKLCNSKGWKLEGNSLVLPDSEEQIKSTAEIKRLFQAKKIKSLSQSMIFLESKHLH